MLEYQMKKFHHLIWNSININLLHLFLDVGLGLFFTICLRVNISPTIFCVWVHAWLDMHKITQQKISIWFNMTTRELGLVEKIVSLQRNKIGIRIRSIGFYNSINLNRIILEIYFLILHCIKYLIQGSDERYI